MFEVSVARAWRTGEPFRVSQLAEVHALSHASKRCAESQNPGSQTGSQHRRPPATAHGYSTAEIGLFTVSFRHQRTPTNTPGVHDAQGVGGSSPSWRTPESLETRGSCFGKVRHFCVLRPSGSQRDLFRFQNVPSCGPDVLVGSTGRWPIPAVITERSSRNAERPERAAAAAFIASVTSLPWSRFMRVAMIRQGAC